MTVWLHTAFWPRFFSSVPVDSKDYEVCINHSGPKEKQRRREWFPLTACWRWYRLTGPLVCVTAGSVQQWHTSSQRPGTLTPLLQIEPCVNRRKKKKAEGFRDMHWSELKPLFAFSYRYINHHHHHHHHHHHGRWCCYKRFRWSLVGQMYCLNHWKLTMSILLVIYWHLYHFTVTSFVILTPGNNCNNWTKCQCRLTGPLLNNVRRAVGPCSSVTYLPEGQGHWHPRAVCQQNKRLWCRQPWNALRIDGEDFQGRHNFCELFFFSLILSSSIPSSS